MRLVAWLLVLHEMVNLAPWAMYIGKPTSEFEDAI